MKRVILVFVFFGSFVSISADYVTSLMSCKHISGQGYTYFVVLGTGTDLSPQNANSMLKFLKTKYASKIKNFCKDGSVFEKMEVYAYKKKYKVVKKFRELWSYANSYDSNSRKNYKIRFYHEKQWR